MNKQDNKTSSLKIENEPPQRTFGQELFEHIRVGVIATFVLAIIVSSIYPAAVFLLAQVLFHNKANGSLIGKDGQPVSDDKDAVASALIGQSFSDAKYFHPRPSSAGNGYDPTASGGSNLGPMSAKLINGTTKPTTMPATQPAGDPLPGPDAVDFDGIHDRIVHYCLDNSIQYTSSVPLKQFQDAQGNLDDVKLIKAFNDDKAPLVFTPKDPLPADAVTASGSGLDPHISPDNAVIQKARVAHARGISIDQVQQLIDENTDGPGLGILGDAGVNVLRLNLALDVKYPPPAPPATQPAAK
jgi:K+-transporting ATPase ATPase C chain